ncbi:hypothetical protein [Chryseobacterium sp.]|uniref:hypothetical protein n=1 Tax=Chryseobacterium sp. TaxID=1871047 RepID=UPI002FC79194
MDKHVQLKQQLKDLIDANPNFPIVGVVRSIEGDTCTVEVLEELELSDIRLKATADGNDHLLIIPKIGSNVLMLSSDGTVDNMTVIKCDQASKFIFNENGLQVEIDSEDKKVCIKNNQVSLHDILNDLSTLLQQLKVYTPMGPSGTPLPDSILAIQKFETDFKKILK